jgi:hypothetical protein
MKLWLGVLAVVAMGCATQSSSPPAGATQDLESAKVLLPTGDTCRGVLAPLAAGLAEGALGKSSTATVSLVSSTYVRDYVVRISNGTSQVVYSVELDNDSSFMCLLDKVWLDPGAELENDARSEATAAELSPSVPTPKIPDHDYCASTVAALGKAAAVSAVAPASVEHIDVSVDGADYVAHVDGKSFVANGTTFANDWDYRFVLDDECRVQDIGFK